MQDIYIDKTFAVPLERVFAMLSDHERLGVVLGANIRRIRDGKQGGVNGLGSVRLLTLAPGLSFEETVTGFEEGKRIEYVISKGSPLKNHKGVMEFSEEGGRARLRYRIVFESRLPVPFLARIVAWGLERNISKGLDKVNALA
jgi:hypothetical protein